MPDKKELEDKLAQLRKEGEERAAKKLAVKLNLKYLSLTTTPISVEALTLIPQEVAQKAQIAVIEKKVKKLAAVSTNPQNEETKKVIKDLESRGMEVSVFVVSPSGFEYVLSYYKFIGKKAEEITGKVKIKKAVSAEEFNTLEKIKTVLGQQEFLGSNAGDILEVILDSAMATRASDIHFEPSEIDAKLRLRIDGILHDVFIIAKSFYPFLVSRVKLLSNLKLNITDESQDGRFTIKFAKKDVEVRVAVAPAQFGEVIVMRILDPDAINLNLSDLGIREDDLEIIMSQLKRPNGLVLNTGPTGSGKTTTLYAFLKNVANSEIKIITVEDPIEYHLENIQQTQVDEEAGYTFADGLKSIMRQDPDIILIGEIRDKETAEIGIQAALTGHLVFSTVHANSSTGAIPRLLDLGVKVVSIGPALNLVIAQRLVRRLCKNCKIPTPVNDDIKNKIQKFLGNLPARVKKETYKEIKFFEPKGCEVCNNTGYKGRVAIYELLAMEPEIEELILKQAGETALHKYAIERGMTTMQQDGILKIINGLTTIEEIESTTGPLEW
ncbi:MAG: ATPase, T2SS/T4P/T4SS family [Patescibacteria group bacterium]